MIKKRNIVFLILIVSIITLNIPKCFAVTLKFKGTIEDGNQGYKPGEEPKFNWITKDDSAIEIGKSRYEYGYRKKITVGTSIPINAYNLNGTSLMPNSLQIDQINALAAGTWVGINVTEMHSATWQIWDIKYREVKKQYICNYIKYTSKTKYEVITEFENIKEDTQQEAYCKYYSNSKNCDNYKVENDKCYCGKTTWNGDNSTQTISVGYKETPECPAEYEGAKLDKNNPHTELSEHSYDEDNIPSKAIIQLKEKAIKEVRQNARDNVSYSSAQIKYIAKNDYNEDKELGTISTGYSNKFDKDEIVERTNQRVTGIVEKSYELLEKNVCINVFTSDVTYGRECEKEEIKIENGSLYDNNLNKTVKYWHYFIPLNIKSSNQEFFLNVTKNENRKFSVDTCINYMKENQNYKEVIVPVYEENDKFKIGELIGDYHNFKNENNSKDFVALTKSSGCSIHTIIYFPIVQKFYNEVTDKKGNITFKGFNFYYKPIDINNVFPNGVSENSLWKDWYNTLENGKKVTPDISKSYEVETYEALNINTSVVRAYNKENAYTSWAGMSITGQSSFIKDKGIITSEVNPGSYYKLGCGPLNSKQKLANGKKNPLYIKGCGTS